MSYKYNNISIIYTDNVNKLKTEKEELKAKLETIDAQIDAELKGTLILCKYCKKATPIAETTYIQTHWYVTPYSCNGGDYWASGESQWACPECGKIHRFDNKTDKYTTMADPMYYPEFTKLKKYFKEVVDKYK